jgi:hypothetical protein
MPKTFHDLADWDGIAFESVDVGAGNKPKSMIFEGYQYATQGEVRLARVLKHMGIAFTPDVRIRLETPDGRDRFFVPDFIFDRKPFIWTARGKRKMIHGIEAKGKTRSGAFSEKALENVRLLHEQRGIVILLLSNSQIKSFWNKMKLPLHPLHGSRTS